MCANPHSAKPPPLPTPPNTMPASRLCDPRTIISSLSRIRAAYFSSPQVNALRPPRRTCPLPRPPATQRYVCSRRVMTTRCLGVRTDEHGNSATIIQEPPQPLEETCRRVHERVQEFLKREYKNGERLRDVQVQTRRSLGVVGEALERYRYVFVLPGEREGRRGCGGKYGIDAMGRRNVC